MPLVFESSRIVGPSLAMVAGLNSRVEQLTLPSAVQTGVPLTGVGVTPLVQVPTPVPVKLGQLPRLHGVPIGLLVQPQFALEPPEPGATELARRQFAFLPMTRVF